MSSAYIDEAWQQAKEREGTLRQDVEAACSKMLGVLMQINAPIKEKLSKIEEVFHNLKVKVEEPQLQINPPTLPEEVERSEKV